MRSALMWLAVAGCATASAASGSRPTMEAPPMPAPSSAAQQRQAQPQPSSSGKGGFDAYRFGMTPDEVRAVPDCRPYQIIARTDLECPNLLVDGQRRNVSFHFDASGQLVKIQLWFAERVALDDGVQAVLDMNEHFARRFGATQPPNARELITNILRPMQNTRTGFVARPGGDKLPPDAVVWGEVSSMPGLGFFVMAYYQDPAAP